MPKTISFQDVLASLSDSKKAIPQGHLKYFSDLDPKSLQLFLNTWKSLPQTRKLLLLDKLLEHFEEDTIVSYEEIGKALLADADAEVRTRAIGLLIESEDPKLVEKVLDIFLVDLEPAPRMEALRLLGEFLLMGEFESIDKKLQAQVEDALIFVIRGEINADLRRRSLEILGFSSREEIPSLIEAAFERADPAWVACALRAMGHSQDERWNEDVIGKLLDEETPIKAAAVEAAGMLGIQESVPLLIQLLDDEEEDDDVAAAAIWSLSQIGGDDARTYLVGLADQTEDEELADILEEAIENLDFMADINKFDLLALEDDDFDEDEDK
jgi:HEAT repeat protein